MCLAHIPREPFLSLSCWDWVSPDTGTGASTLAQQGQILKTTQQLPATLTNYRQILHHTPSLRQQQYDSQAQKMMHNWLVLDFLLAEQGAVCSSQGTSYCRYINNSGQVQPNLHKPCQGLQIDLSRPWRLSPCNEAWASGPWQTSHSNI